MSKEIICHVMKEPLDFYKKSETYSKEEVNEIVSYASETVKGMSRMWVTTEEGENVLNIATED